MEKPIVRYDEMLKAYTFDICGRSVHVAGGRSIEDRVHAMQAAVNAVWQAMNADAARSYVRGQEDAQKEMREALGIYE